MDLNLRHVPFGRQNPFHLPNLQDWQLEGNQTQWEPAPSWQFVPNTSMLVVLDSHIHIIWYHKLISLLKNSHHVGIPISCQEMHEYAHFQLGVKCVCLHFEGEIFAYEVVNIRGLLTQLDQISDIHSNLEELNPICIHLIFLIWAEPLVLSINHLWCCFVSPLGSCCLK